LIATAALGASIAMAPNAHEAATTPKVRLSIDDARPRLDRDRAGITRWGKAVMTAQCYVGTTRKRRRPGRRVGDRRRSAFVAADEAES